MTRPAIRRKKAGLAPFCLSVLAAGAGSCTGPGTGASPDEPGPVASLSQSLPVPPRAAVSLGSYNADISQSSVSGISSGGYMAVQLDLAFSSIFAGVGVLAAGPYHCAGSGLTAVTVALTTCAQGSPAVDVNSLISATDRRAASGDIDATSNLSRQKVWLFSGTRDTTVKRPVVDALLRYYQHYVPAANIAYKNDINAAHAHITDSYGNSCTTVGSPYINNCGYDAAGALLQHIYSSSGTLSPRNTGTLSGQLIQFDQSEFIENPASKSMDTTGWVYVPAACARKEPCKVHIALHGCEQSQPQIHDAYYAHGGYNQWADTNHIIVLYPQAIASSFSPTNPKACWDWWGYNDAATYDTKRGAQMAAIKKMVDRLTSGFAALPAPTGLVVKGSADTSVSLAFDAVAGATGYSVYRAPGGGGTFTRITGAPITATAYTDTGLSPGTTYAYQVRAVSSSGTEGAASSPVSATTTGHAPPPSVPGNLTVSGTTASSVSLSFTASPGAAGYNVYRSATAGGTASKVNPTLLSGTTFTDSGLSAATTYYYVVTAQNSAGEESAPSGQVAATTAAAATCYRDNNWNHYLAGRATSCSGFACAVGSGQNMGLLNILITTTLKQTGPSYYVIGTCP